MDSRRANLHAAKRAKQDEFYARLADIERADIIKKRFRGKVVYCNCDDPRVSNFFHCFSHRFEALGLKKPIAACCKSRNPNLFSRNDSERDIRLEYEGEKDGDTAPDPKETGIFPLQGDGDFRSAERIELLRQADIVCANPPFSLFRERLAQRVEYGKKFLVTGHMNAIAYKEIFSLIKENRMRLGYAGNTAMEFGAPARYPLPGAQTRIDADGRKYVKAPDISWFANLGIRKRREELILWKPYIPEAYPKYDDYDAIDANKTKETPKDYAGIMGVLISFLDKRNPDPFEIIQLRKGAEEKDLRIHGKRPCFRILIRNKRPVVT